MTGMAILQPMVVLAAWTMVMWWWMYATRLPAGAGGRLDPEKVRNSGPAILDELLPPEAQRKAHNYNHLHEAPTVFYAVTLLLAIVGAGDGLATQLAWAYAGLRIAHSLVQATINKVEVRFALFALSSFALMALVGLAIRAVF
jgi:hypothetical protein